MTRLVIVGLLLTAASASWFGGQAAAPSTPVTFIEVDADALLDGAANIGNFMGMQGPGTDDWRSPDPFLVQAWTALGLNVAEVGLFDDSGLWGGVKVTRDPQGGLELDFSDLDTYVIGYLHGALQAEVEFACIWMPRALSYRPESPYSWAMAPRDYQEWYEIVHRTVRHIVDDLGISGAAYQVWDEPHPELWKGKDRSNPLDIQLLTDLLEMYYWTWQAVKVADPTARVGAPMTATCSEIYEEGWGALGFGLEDVIRGIAEHNRQNPADPITLDYVIYQDYNWIQYPYPGVLADGTFTDCAAHVRDVLREAGMPEETPQILIGWNDGAIDLARNAAHLTYNILEHTAPDGQRGITRAYFWPFGPDYDGAFGLVNHPPQGRYCKRQAYAAMQALHDMEDGTYVQTALVTPGGAPRQRPLKIMATREGTQRVVAILVNYGDAADQVGLRFVDLPFQSQRVLQTIKRIDSSYSTGCEGLEAGLSEAVPLLGSSIEVRLDLPANSIRQVLLEPYEAHRWAPRIRPGSRGPGAPRLHSGPWPRRPDR